MLGGPPNLGRPEDLNPSFDLRGEVSQQLLVILRPRRPDETLQLRVEVRGIVHVLDAFVQGALVDDPALRADPSRLADDHPQSDENMRATLFLSRDAASMSDSRSVGTVSRIVTPSRAMPAARRAWSAGSPASRSMTWSTRTSGADAPAVMPTVLMPLSQAGSSSAAVPSK